MNAEAAIDISHLSLLRQIALRDYRLALLGENALVLWEEWGMEPTTVSDDRAYWELKIVLTASGRARKLVWELPELNTRLVYPISAVFHTWNLYKGDALPFKLEVGGADNWGKLDLQTLDGKRAQWSNGREVYAP